MNENTSKSINYKIDKVPEFGDNLITVSQNINYQKYYILIK